MDLKKSDESKKELEAFKQLDDAIGRGLDECLRFLELETDEFAGDAGLSIESIKALKERGIYVFRLRYDEAIDGLRIFFIRLRNATFVTGIHKREDLGESYDMLREPFVRAIRYWGRRRYL